MASSSPSSHDWLELGLGYKTTNKQQQQQQDDKKLAYSSTTSQHLEAHNINDEEEEEEEEGTLDLRLQIGPKQIDYSVTKFGHFHHSSPNSGLWFSLRSSPIRKGGAALPQIPKPYIRVKDEKMTVLMVKKYLVTKLCLSNEAEVELWCMGERLVQSQSLKEVRDGVWLPKLVEFVNSNNSSLSTSSSTYLMCLYYGTTCLFSL